METNSAFCAYEGFYEEVYRVEEHPSNSLSEEFYDYYGTPQMPSYHCGSPFADYRDYSCETYSYDYNAVYYLQPAYLIYYPVIPVEYSAVYTYFPCYEYAPVYCQDYVMNYNYSVPTTTYYGSDSNFIFPGTVYESPLPSSPVEPNVFASEEYDFDLYNIENREVPLCEYAPSEAVTSLAMYYEEEGEHLNDAPFNSDDDKKNGDDPKNGDDNGDTSLGEKKSMNPDCVKESPAYRKFCSEVEERRKKIGASSQVQKTFINRGVVADPSEYRKFCGSVEDRIKKFSESSPGKKSIPDRDAVQSSYRKFLSTVEERREILNSSSVRQKTYVNRGIVADPSEYRKFCQSVDYKIKKLGSPKNSKSFEVKDFIAKQDKQAHEERVVHEVSSHSFRDMILKSAEYLHVQDNLKNSKYYRDLLYKEALRKQNKSTLMEILPSIIEEPFNFEDVTAECGELHVAEPRELNSNDEPKPVIIKTKQPKNRFKSFRKWWTKTFCCCCTTNQPP